MAVGVWIFLMVLLAGIIWGLNRLAQETGEERERRRNAEARNDMLGKIASRPSVPTLDHTVLAERARKRNRLRDLQRKKS